jgi:carbon storage regulator CsrA
MGKSPQAAFTEGSVMLVLSRRPRETIRIGADITLTIIEIQGNHVRVGIEAPRQHKILRGELNVRPPALHRSVSQSQSETPPGSEAETTLLAGPLEFSLCIICD